MVSQTITAARAGASAPQDRLKPRVQVRFAFIDSLRILLVILVILHHLAIGNGAEGAWNYRESQPADLFLGRRLFERASPGSKDPVASRKTPVRAAVALEPCRLCRHGLWLWHRF
jgi:hypothetical protein